MTVLPIDAELDGERLDAALSYLFPDQSRSRFQKLIKEGHVFVNQAVTLKPGLRLNEGDTVGVDIPAPAELSVLPEEMDLDIVYEDADVILVNKPKGMVVHPAAGHYSGTLVNGLLAHCTDLSGINGVLRPGIVHRIDKDTTGIVIACKNDRAHNAVAAQLKAHTIRRRYYAIVTGNLKEDEGCVDAPIGRNPSDRKKMAVVPDGKNAVTHYRVLERFGQYTFIECALETGRTHQIRVHMAHIGHPLLGDEVYSKAKSRFRTEGQCLHAYMLGFVHPSTGEYMEFTSELPDGFKKILNELRND
ncbi:MAG: RluA family pseudouridine synthase [Lachnospiraceae bacterium]|nr:RluA family pseudouridine synthase [Lachnospiraceae bacterium]